MRTHNLADLYDLPALEWSSITERLDRGSITQAPDSGGPNRHTCWLTTLDAATVARMAETWAGGGWPCRVDESGTALTAEFSAPSAGKPPWHAYRITPVSAVALSTVGPGGATRWEF